MPEYLRALIVILILATAFFSFARRLYPITAEPENFTRRRNIWIGITLAAFLSHSFWIYTMISIPLLLIANRHENNPPALFFFILFAVPMAIVSIPGLGLMNFIFELSHARLLALMILLPAFISLLQKSDNLSFGRTVPDKVLIAYLLLTLILFLGESSLTNTLRLVFYLFIDIFLPYYVISRSLKNLQAFHDALLSLALAIMLLAIIALFEFSKHWLLYQPLLEILGLNEGMTGYLERGVSLRAVASAGQPIALGFLMAVGLGLYLFLKRSVTHKVVRRLGTMLLIAGLIVPLSRGPWVGAGVLMITFTATGTSAVRKLMGLALLATLTFSMVSLMPGGERAVNLLPFIGKTETGSIDYREKLITNSLIVIKRNLWFGSVDFLETPEMEAMRQGQNIIDVVNSYIAITLEKGLVGLGLFVAFFIMVVFGIYKAMRSILDRNSEEYLLGRALLATLLAIMTIIFTVSSITIIPIVYWSVAGLGVAYAQMVRNNPT